MRKIILMLAISLFALACNKSPVVPVTTDSTLSVLPSWSTGNYTTTDLSANEIPAYLENGTLAPDPVPPATMLWGIWPSRTTIANMFPGAEADYFVGIYNGRTTPATFTIAARTPDKLDTGAKALPLSWITITPNTIVVPGKTSTKVSVIIKVPLTATEKFYQTYVGVKNSSESGNVRLENASNWRIKLN